MRSSRLLNIASPDLTLQKKISQELKISKILAQVLLNRGIKNTAEAHKFLHAKLEHLLNPYTFEQMPHAVSLIQQAAKNKEKVMIFGDYDVDGITALAILKNTLQKLGISAMHYIPHRVKEGYGLNKNILQLICQKGVKLLITVDCGINSHAEIKELRKHNIEVIVTDHHEPVGEEKTCASAVINPKAKGTHYKFRELAGVGVAYKLCQALTQNKLVEDLDLVTLGTIADVVPLIGENRIMVKAGLSNFAETKRAGLKALIESSGIKNKKFTTTFISYILGPRLNASGRMDTAETALNLILSVDAREAAELAQKIEGYNRQRQKIESKILEEAEALIAKEVNFKEHKIIVIAKEDWHQGVLGIVASKLSDRFYRPTVLISLTKGLCKGSARSIKNFHLFKALTECQDLLENFGGHSHAAGLVISKNKILDFKQAINNFALEHLRIEDLIPSVDIDMQLLLSDLNEEVIRELELLEPFGTDNPQPLFFTPGLKLKGEPLALGRETLKFWVTDGTLTYQAIGFRMSSFKDSLMKADAFDLVYTPRMDSWGGDDSMLLEAKDIIFR